MRTTLVLLLLVLLAPFARPAQAQNIQLHYDFGRQLYDKDQANRPRWTTTVEMFRPDRWGQYLLFRRHELRQRGSRIGLLGNLA